MSSGDQNQSRSGATLSLPDQDLIPELSKDPQRSIIPVSVEHVPRRCSTIESLLDVSPASDVLDELSFARNASTLTESTVNPPVDGSIDSIQAYLESRPTVPVFNGTPNFIRGTLPQRVDHRAWQTELVASQGSRGTCWAFAGIAALEAAYARQGIQVKLSEQYLFHISKAHENQRVGPGIHSLIGAQGSADVVHHLKYWRVPLYNHAPYIDQLALQALADRIPGTSGALINAGAGSKEQADWFEFDLRHIPLTARWLAQYAVAEYGLLHNYSLEELKRTLADGYDVVINVPNHVVLVYGYDDSLGALLIKNSQSLPGFETMLYTGDPRFRLVNSEAYFIKSVRPVETQWAAMWVGRWEIDHDGWRGRIVIRRFLDVHSDKGLPDPGASIDLGTWYGRDGTERPVVGGFVDGGRGLHCTIGGQPFELYLHSSDPYRAAGRCLLGNVWFGVVVSRGTATGAGSGFDRSEALGLWDIVHDGFRGQIRVDGKTVYVQATDGATRKTRIESLNTSHQVNARIDFPGYVGQPFELMHHTREDGVIGGVTRSGGRDWPVEAKMSSNFYIVKADGAVHWYRHIGRYRRVYDWDPPKLVRNGFVDFKSVFGGGDGVIYGILRDGRLIWHYHDGRNRGTRLWVGPKQVGTGWDSFKRVFAGEGGVIYAVNFDGKLSWYRHIGRHDGSFEWQGPFKVGEGWGDFLALAAGPDGIIYGIRRDGKLVWYRHYGYDQGYYLWHGPVEIARDWLEYGEIWVAGNGFLYARDSTGQLWMWRHHGFQTGENNWTPKVKVGDGWQGLGVRFVLLT